MLQAHTPRVLAFKYTPRLLALPSDAPLRRAARVFATGIQRQRFVDAASGEVLGALSQSMAMQCLRSTAAAVGTGLSRSARLLGIGLKPDGADEHVRRGGHGGVPSQWAVRAAHVSECGRDLFSL